MSIKHARVTFEMTVSFVPSVERLPDFDANALCEALWGAVATALGAKLVMSPSLKIEPITADDA